jgi:ATP phosphoribosyltransferase
VIRLALPNKGRLQQPTVDLIRTAGLAFETTDRALSVKARNADIELLFVRTEDVAELVSDGVAELGITGQDLLAEFGAALEVLAELAYGHCRLAAAVPTGSHVAKLEDLAGLRVATAHPHATSRFFGRRGIAVTVVPLRGSVEVATKLGVADAIVDLVSTGSTLMVNGLREVGLVLASQAVLVARPADGNGAADNGASGRVATAIKAVVAGRGKRYLLLNAPAHAVDTISTLIPGLEAPTVVPLAEQGMVEIHSVVAADDIWNLLPRLEEAGGTGILVVPIEQLVP